jgi:hypothetical protein
MGGALESRNRINKAEAMASLATLFMLLIMTNPVQGQGCVDCCPNCGDCWSDCQTEYEEIGEVSRDLGWVATWKFQDPCGAWWVVWKHYMKYGHKYEKTSVCQEYCWCNNNKQYEAKGVPQIIPMGTVTLWEPRVAIDTKVLRAGEYP